MDTKEGKGMITLGLVFIIGGLYLGSRNEQARENGTVAVTILAGIMFVVVGIAT